MTVTIRPATIDDFDVVLVLNSICFPSPQENMSVDDCSSFLESHFYVAETTEDKEEKSVVGFICGSSKSRWKYPTIMKHNEAMIVKIGVSPAYRKQGIASRLLQHVESVLKEQAKCPTIWLQVRESNTVAQNVYKKFGLVEQQRFHYYSDYEDSTANTIAGEKAILMCKTITYNISVSNLEHVDDVDL